MFDQNVKSAARQLRWAIESSHHNIPGAFEQLKSALGGWVTVPPPTDISTLYMLCLVLTQPEGA